MSETETLPQTITSQRLESLGFKKLAAHVAHLKQKKWKLMTAYEHYRVVSMDKVLAFNENLQKKTFKENPGTFSQSWQTLAFCSVEKYDKVPPEPVLAEMQIAVDRKCFDSFEVAHIKEVVKDPLLFGRIDGCTDRFFIAQWDDDVKISDLLKANEG